PHHQPVAFGSNERAGYVLADANQLAAPAAPGAPGPGGLGRVRGPLRSPDPRLVPPLGPAGGRRPGRHPGRPPAPGPEAARLPLRPRPALSRLAEDPDPPRLERLPRRPRAGAERRQRRSLRAGDSPGARRPGPPPARDLRPGIARAGLRAGARA